MYTKKGIWNIRRRRFTRTLAVLLAIVGGYRFKQSGLGLKDLRSMLQNVVQGCVASVMQAVKN